MKTLLVLTFLYFSFLGEVTAKDDGSTDLSAHCLANFSLCKTKATVLSVAQVQTYDKAINCLKRGSTTDDTFSLGIQIEEVPIGFDFGSKAIYSTETCKEEIRKLNSSLFLQSYNEVFDSSCGVNVLAQNTQCLKLVGNDSSKNGLTCTSSQTPSQLIINTKYVVRGKENSEDYIIKDVIGLGGMDCKVGTSPGVGMFAATSCTLPENFNSSTVVLRLANDITCSVPVSAKFDLALQSAKRHSCSAILSGQFDELKLKNGKPTPELLKMAAIGLCDSCLQVNLDQPSTDQRSLKARLAGCVAWSKLSTTENKGKVCEVVPSSSVTTSSPILSGYGNPFLTKPGMPYAPEIGPTAPGTVRGAYLNLSLESVNPENTNTRWVNSLCNGRDAGQVVELNGDRWKSIPIGYENSKKMVSPEFSPFMQSIYRAIGTE